MEDAFIAAAGSSTEDHEMAELNDHEKTHTYEVDERTDEDSFASAVLDHIETAAVALSFVRMDEQNEAALCMQSFSTDPRIAQTTTTQFWRLSIERIKSLNQRPLNRVLRSLNQTQSKLMCPLEQPLQAQILGHLGRRIRIILPNTTRNTVFFISRGTRMCKVVFCAVVQYGYSSVQGFTNPTGRHSKKDILSLVFPVHTSKQHVHDAYVSAQTGLKDAVKDIVKPAKFSKLQKPL
eukprot:IDg20339t1